MTTKVRNLMWLLAFTMLLHKCANRGNPSGGPKDITPPVITKTEPENLSTNFTADEIEIFFDEYIKIKDIRKNLIISPPMDPEPIITPLGSASKSIKIKILDTLKANTTYAFNFGESIVDNNEENPYPYYRYVFSTGPAIDSLSVRGTISDAFDRIPEEFVSVMLYEIDSTFTDSIVYFEKPDYIGNSSDSLSAYKIENLKAGKYLIVGLKDENGNYTFQQKLDKIGYADNIIEVPKDSIVDITLFREEIDFKFFTPRLAGYQKISFGYEGDFKKLDIKLLSNVPSEFESRITKDPKADTLYYWFKPGIDTDSLLFELKTAGLADTVTVRLRDQLKDSLQLKSAIASILKPEQDFEIEANIPFEKFDKSLVRLTDRDSVDVPFGYEIDTLFNRYRIQFEKTEQNTYKLDVFPGAITDFFGNVNDSLSYNIRTRSLSDYGNVRLILNNAKYPLIAQLVDPSDRVEEELYATEPGPLDFTNVNPNKYYLRIIYDSNGNRKYDPGSFLKRRQSERVIYYPEQLDVRASWNFIEEFTLQD